MAAVLAAARLPEPVLTSEAPAERGADAVGWPVIGTDITRLLPLIERAGVATADDGADTFEQRLRAQAAAHDAVLLNPLVVGASARTQLARHRVERDRRRIDADVDATRQQRPPTRSQLIFSNTFSIASGAPVIIGGPSLALVAGRRDDSDAVRTMCGLQLPRRQR